MNERHGPRGTVLSTLIACAPEIPTLHVLSSVLDAAQAAIRSIWGEDDSGEILGPPPYEQEAELARAVLAHITELAAAVSRYREAMLWRVPNDPLRRDFLDPSLERDDTPGDLPF